MHIVQRKFTIRIFASLAILALVASAHEPLAVTVTEGKIQGGTLNRGVWAFSGSTSIWN